MDVCVWNILYEFRRRQRGLCPADSSEIQWLLLVDHDEIRPNLRVSIRVYSEWTRQRNNDGVKRGALVSEHMLINRSILTGRAALQFLKKSDTVVMTLARPVLIDHDIKACVHRRRCRSALSDRSWA